jgi:uncharacterized SAM-binding protein YcdF (DUF218 family)
MRKLLPMLGFLLLLGFAWLMRHSILRKVASLWIISDRIAQADAIVVLGGRSDLRPGAAAELYKCGLAPQILVPDGQEVNRTMLLRGGIPSGAIVSYGSGVSSTYDEAHAVNDWATQSKAKRIIVITEIFGSRRVRWIFNRALRGIGVQVQVLALTPEQYSKDDWWQTQEGISALWKEVVKYSYYRLRY